MQLPGTTGFKEDSTLLSFLGNLMGKVHKLLFNSCRILFLDAKRSDFWQMLVHHFITLALIGVSWTMNMVRVGTLILVSHDAVDILM